MSDNIIQFPGASDASDKPEQSEANRQLESLGLPQMSPDQEKAMQIILSGMSFVCIGIQDTDGGADFFTAIDGQDETIRNAQGHLQGVIDRACDRKGI